MDIRNDIHSPRNIIPGNYQYIMSYAGGGGGGDSPAFNVQEAIKIKKNNDFFGDGIFNCSICGTAFRFGDIWIHIPTKTYIAVGWRCAEKYGLMVDRSEFQKKRAVEIERIVKEERKREFLKNYPDLNFVFESENSFISKMKDRIEKGWELSDKMITAIKKIKDNQDKAIDAPVGRAKIIGEIIKVKENFYNGKYSWKMTVKITENNGEWFCYGTVPANIENKYHLRENAPEGDMNDFLQGKQISFVATLKNGKEKNFSFFKRPAKAFLTLPGVASCELRGTK